MGGVVYTAVITECRPNELASPVEQTLAEARDSIPDRLRPIYVDMIGTLPLGTRSRSSWLRAGLTQLTHLRGPTGSGWHITTATPLYTGVGATLTRAGYGERMPNTTTRSLERAEAASANPHVHTRGGVRVSGL